MDFWTIVWLLWGVGFFVPEGVALWREHKGKAHDATLSEHIWNWFAVKNPRGPAWWVHLRRIVLALFMVELTVHFMAGRWWL